MPTNGRSISMTDAQNFIDAQQSIHSANISSLNTFFGSNAEAKSFYCNPSNAFVFDVSLFTRFNNPAPTHFVVILGAHPNAITGDNVAKGDPTIVAVACTYDSATDKYTPINIAKPANEHPPKRLITDFPG